MKKFLLAAQTLLLLFAAAPNVQAQKSYDLKKFPKGCRPEEIGVRLTGRYLQTPHSHWGDINSKHKVTLVTYPDVCAWLGALWFTAGTGNDSLYTRLVERFEPLFTTHLAGAQPLDAGKADLGRARQATAGAKEEACGKQYARRKTPTTRDQRYLPQSTPRISPERRNWRCMARPPISDTGSWLLVATSPR